MPTSDGSLFVKAQGGVAIYPPAAVADK